MKLRDVERTAAGYYQPWRLFKRLLIELCAGAALILDL
jgi:hypothetical protein